MTDLSATYLGLQLKNPLVASASPLSRKLDTARKLEQAGIAAIVMHSLFEEQIIHESLELDHYLTRGTNSAPEAMSYLPDSGQYSLLPDKYIDNLTRLKKTLSIPVIGSLNGVSKGGWTRYARLIQDAGADALELNLYYIPTDPSLTAQELEDTQVELVADIRASIKIPLAVKLSPFYTSLPHFTRRLAAAGANGLVLFNRFYQPDFDLEQLTISPSLDLSTSADLRLPLRWISILHGRLQVDLALTGGVHTSSDVLKTMMSGASAAMLASELLQNGIQRVPVLLAEIQAWMEAHEYTSIQQMRGSLSQKAAPEPAAFERANYMKVLSSFRDLV